MGGEQDSKSSGDSEHSFIKNYVGNNIDPLSDIKGFERFQHKPQVSEEFFAEDNY